MCDEFVDNLDYDDRHYNEYPIRNLNARYRCFPAKPFRGFLPDCPISWRPRHHNAFDLYLGSRHELKIL